MSFIFNQLLRFGCIVVGIIMMSGLPKLLPSDGSITLNWSSYISSIKEVFQGLLNIQEITYSTGGATRALLPQLTGIVSYSLIILIGALFIALVTAAFFTLVTMILQEKWRRKVKVFTFILESIPDLLIILMCQLSIVWLFKKTGLLIFEVASLPGEPIYLLPMICLSILPMIQYYKVMVSITEIELEKQYVDLAKSKGVYPTMILIYHVLRNALGSLLNYSKTVIWFMLSNLLILEYIFNINGIMSFLLEYLEPTVFALSLLAIFIPIFLFFAIGQWLLERFTNEKVVM